MVTENCFIYCANFTYLELCSRCTNSKKHIIYTLNQFCNLIYKINSFSFTLELRTLIILNRFVMKLNLFAILLVALLTASCSQEPVISSSANLSMETMENSKTHCVYSTLCDVNYTFPIRNGANYDCFSVIYDNSLTIAEIQCVRYNYFNCFPLLALDKTQPADPYQDDWCYLNIGRPLKSLSKIIKSDPRLRLEADE